MKKHIAPPPRKIPILTRLVILNSNIYSLGGWVATGIGSLAIWLVVVIPDFFIPGLLAGIPFLALGLISLIKYTLGDGIKTINLLKNGEVTYGKLLKSEHEGLQRMKGTLNFIDDTESLLSHGIDRPVPSDDRLAREELAEQILKPDLDHRQAEVIMKYYFEFKTKQGTTHQVEALSKYADGGVLEDDEEELILYFPNNPGRAVVYDSLKNAPKILQGGNLGGISANKLTVLIAPVLVILMNLGFFGFSYPDIGFSQNISISKTMEIINDDQDPLSNMFDLMENRNGEENDEMLPFFEKEFHKFTNIPGDSIKPDDRFTGFSLYSMISSLEQDPMKQYDRATELRDHTNKILDAHPQDSILIEYMANVHIMHSRAALFIQSFEEAERDARKALELTPENSFYQSDLAIALLFQGKFEQSEAIYLEWKDKENPDEIDRQEFPTFKEIFLTDLQTLEDAGITHPDVEKAKRLLMN